MNTQGRLSNWFASRTIVQCPFRALVRIAHICSKRCWQSATACRITVYRACRQRLTEKRWFLWPQCTAFYILPAYGAFWQAVSLKYQKPVRPSLPTAGSFLPESSKSQMPLGIRVSSLPIPNVPYEASESRSAAIRPLGQYYPTARFLLLLRRAQTRSLRGSYGPLSVTTTVLFLVRSSSRCADCRSMRR